MFVAEKRFNITSSQLDVSDSFTCFFLFVYKFKIIACCLAFGYKKRKKKQKIERLILLHKRSKDKFIKRPIKKQKQKNQSPLLFFLL